MRGEEEEVGAIVALRREDVCIVVVVDRWLSLCVAIARMLVTLSNER
jgi:hypothetical protein